MCEKISVTHFSKVSKVSKNKEKLGVGGEKENQKTLHYCTGRILNITKLDGSFENYSLEMYVF